jgi:hypothetical protein
MLRFFLFGIVSFFVQFAFAQVTMNGEKLFCNEWIQKDQSYYKLEVSKDGIYKVTVEELLAKGIDLRNKSSENLQIIHLGKQIPIYVSKQGNLQEQDYILFFGEQNRAAFEYPLFANANELLNPNYSMFTDVSAYFLSWNNSSQNTRISFIENQITDTIPRDNYYQHEELIVFADVANKRGQGFGNNLKYPKFDVGQGYCTGAFSEKIVNLNFKHVYNNFEPAIVNAILGGTGEDGTRHKAEFFINGESKGFESFTGFKVRTGSFEIPADLIAETVALQIKANGSPDEKLVLSNVIYRYNRTFNFDQAKSAFINISASSIRKHIVLNDFNGGDKVWLLDITNNLLLSTSRNADGTYSFQIPLSINDRKIIVFADDEMFKVNTISPMKSEDIQQADFNYLILSNEKLIQDPSQNVQKYAAYRSSVAGGSYKVKIVDVTKLYDQFAYGIKGHSTALRNYFNYVKEFYPNLANVFIIGKGLEFKNYRKDNSIEDLYNLVPTYGIPGSDPLLVCDVNDKQLYALGRLPVLEASEIATYLDKVKEHEYYINNQATEHEKMQWTKRIIHLAGGDPSLYETLQSHLDGMKDIIQTNQFGASVKTFHKEQSAIEGGENLTELMDMINEGVSMITFMGHSAQFKLDFNILNPASYQNKGKYHTFLAMGCYAGQIFETHKSISELNNLTPEKGSIVYLSNSTAGIPYVLSVYGGELYRTMGGSYYGKSMGEAIKATNNIILESSDEFIKTQAFSLTFNGDPAIRMNVLKGQDFKPVAALVKTPNSSAIFIEDKSFNIDVEILNLGVNYNDSLDVELKMKFPTGEIKTVLNTRVVSPKYSSVYNFTIPIDKSAVGLNKIFVTVDPKNLINEYPNPNAEKNNELLDSKNELGIDLMIFGNKTKAIYPRNYAIINQNQPTLIAYNSNTFAAANSYYFELDTTVDFNSPLKQSKVVTQTGGSISWPTKLNLISNVVYYWRVAAAQGNTSNLPWLMNSFIYLPNSSEGYNQSHYFQYKDNEFENFKISSNRKFEFDEEEVEFRVANGYIELPNYIRPRIFHGEGYIMDYKYWNLISNMSGIIVSVFNMKTGELWTNVSGSDYGSFGGGSIATLPLFLWKTETKEERKKLMDFITNVIPDGTVAVVQTLRQFQHSYYPENWESDGTNNLFTLFESLGAKEITKLKTVGSVPYNLIFKKGDPSFQVKESVGDLINENELVHSFNIQKKAGEMKSTLVGPSSNWSEFKWSYNNFNGAEDEHNINIIGIKPNGTEEVLVTNLKDVNKDLSSISAVDYPYLKLNWQAKDEISRTAAQMEYWRVLYQTVPDFVMSPALGYTQNKQKVNAGEWFKIQMPVINASNEQGKALLVRYTLVKPNGSKFSQNIRYSSVPANGKITIPFQYRSWFVGGQYQLIIELNPNSDQVESDYTNNIAIINFEIGQKIGLEAGDVPEGDKGKLVKETADNRESEESFVSAELYPNPVRDNAKLSLTLSSEEALSSWSFQLIDSRGAIVMSKSIGNSDQIIEMDRNLNPGFYFYRIKRNDGLKSSEWKKLEIIR